MIRNYTKIQWNSVQSASFPLILINPSRILVIYYLDLGDGQSI